MNRFGPDSYVHLLDFVVEQGFTFSRSPNPVANKSVFLRHDVDLSLDDALELAKIDAGLGLTSTFFVLARSPFYSIMTKEAQGSLREIVSLGHQVGLHFDPTVYETSADLLAEVRRELEVIEWIVDEQCGLVSQHQPSLRGLLDFSTVGDVIDVYDVVRKKEVRYLSDSSMRWREDPFHAIAAAHQIQLLLHPEYWVTSEESLQSVVSRVLRSRIAADKNHFLVELDVMEDYVRTRNTTDSELINLRSSEE